MLLILALIGSFNFKDCEKFCHRQGYDLCVPTPNDKEAYTCADRIEKAGEREMIWTARWADFPATPDEESCDPQI